MILDASLILVPVQSPLSLVGGAGIGFASAVIDLLGAGQGVAPPSIIGATALFGNDFGIGHFKPQFNVVVGTACTTANSATLNVAVQLAADTGAGGGYLPGTWNIINESGPITAANLTAGQTLPRLSLTPVFPPNLRPRFLRLLFQVAAATNFTAGSIAHAEIVVHRDDLGNRQMVRNFTAV